MRLNSPVCSFQRMPLPALFFSRIVLPCSKRQRFNAPRFHAPHAPTLFGGHKAVVRPDPFPNSAVKHSLADGSGFIDSARVGCRQLFQNPNPPPPPPLLLLGFDGAGQIDRHRIISAMNECRLYYESGHTDFSFTRVIATSRLTFMWNGR